MAYGLLLPIDSDGVATLVETYKFATKVHSLSLFHSEILLIGKMQSSVQTLSYGMFSCPNAQQVLQFPRLFSTYGPTSRDNTPTFPDQWIYSSTVSSYHVTLLYTLYSCILVSSFQAKARRALSSQTNTLVRAVIFPGPAARGHPPGDRSHGAIAAGAAATGRGVGNTRKGHTIYTQACVRVNVVNTIEQVNTVNKYI